MNNRDLHEKLSSIVAQWSCLTLAIEKINKLMTLRPETGPGDGDRQLSPLSFLRCFSRLCRTSYLKHRMKYDSFQLMWCVHCCFVGSATSLFFLRVFFFVCVNINLNRPNKRKDISRIDGKRLSESFYSRAQSLFLGHIKTWRRNFKTFFSTSLQIVCWQNKPFHRRRWEEMTKCPVIIVIFFLSLVCRTTFNTRENEPKNGSICARAISGRRSLVGWEMFRLKLSMAEASE